MVTALGGTLKVFANGDWSYAPPANVNDTSSDDFTYTILDFDGDTSQAVQAITVNEDTTAVAGDAAETVSETGLATLF